MSNRMMRTDEEEFRSYCAARLPALLRFGYALTGGDDAARDLVQGALTRTFAAWARVNRHDNPDAYVRRAMVNAASNLRRSRPWREASVADVADVIADRAADRRAYGAAGTAEIDDRLALRGALQQLPARQRATVVLRYYEDRSEEETAEILGCSVGTVKSQAAKGLAKLRSEIQREEVAG